MFNGPTAQGKGGDFPVKGLAGRESLPMGLGRKGILRFAAYSELTREKLGSLTHVESGDGIGEPELEAHPRGEVPRSQGGDNTEFATEGPCSGERGVLRCGGRLVKERNARHGFDPAHHEEVAVTGSEAFGGGGDGLEAGGAIAVHGGGGHVLWNAAAQSDDAGQVCGVGGLGDTPEDDLGNTGGIDPGAGQERDHGVPSEVGRGEPGQIGSHLAERGADGVEDDHEIGGLMGFSHLR